MAQTRQDGAPKGTSYGCYVCGYDTRIDPQNPYYRKEEGVGTYTEGIGVRHKSTKDCMRIIDFMLRGLDHNSRRTWVRGREHS